MRDELPDSNGMPGHAAAQPVTVTLEQRAAKRFTPMIRAAKLVARETEVLCVVRDVSEIGIAVRLFHPLPEDARGVSLVMQDGDRHGLVKIWEQGDRAGFRFAGQVDLSSLLAGHPEMPRRPLRLNLVFGATLACLSGKHAAEVRNLSQQGANVVCKQKLAIDQRVRLSADCMPETEARVRWRHEDCYGLVFDDVLSYPQLARIAAQVQALPQKFPAGTAYSCEAG